MKIIQDDVRLATSTTEDTDWPVTNIQDAFPRNCWKAAQHVQSVSGASAIKLSVYDYYGGSNALYLGNTNAKTGTLSVQPFGGGTEIESKSISFVSSSYFTWLTQRYLETFYEQWIDYTQQSGSRTLVLSLTTDVVSDLTITSGGTGYVAGTFTGTQAAGAVDSFFGSYTVDSSGTIDSVHIINAGTGVTNTTSDPVALVYSSATGSGANITGESTLNLGIARAGMANEFRNPVYGLKEGFIDYSIKKRFSTGAEFYKRRDIVRTFSGSIQSTIESDQTSLLQSIFKQSRQESMAFNLLTNETRGILFGKLTALPSSTRGKLDQMTSSFSIEELL